ncbi:MAG: leucyl aminopeptidase [Cyanobacteria bacterium SZAS TMP-1]|nr:leucyl aminopeptidase [Cyanobacteria bacterium SZAS TMP-1]
MSVIINATSAKLTSALGRVKEGDRANLVLVIFSGEKLAGPALAADELTGGLISRRIEQDGFEPKFIQTKVIDSDLTIDGLDRIILIGLGPRSRLTLNGLRTALAEAFTTARDVAGSENLIFPLIDVDLRGFTVQQFAQAVTEYAILADYEPNHVKTKPWREEAPRTHLLSLTLVSAAHTLSAARKGVKAGTLFAEATNRARDMVNTPSNKMTPAKIAGIARQIARDSGGLIKCEVLKLAQIKKLGMGGVMAVTSGCQYEPAFIVLSYDPEIGVTQPVLGLVGKGITFDSGGLNVKDDDGMRDMKMDMAGAAAVLQAMSLVTSLKPQISVRAVVAACENMIDARSMRQGNLIKTMSGLTIEIDHTDAEGRLTLADAIHYIQEVGQANQVIDVATLTGDVESALGNLVTGAFGNNDRFTRNFLQCAKDAGEAMHECPMPDEYRINNKGRMADLTNSGDGPGHITAAWFLREFVKEGNSWIHLDIAGTGFRRHEHGADPEGATGVATRSLAQLLRQYSKV